MFKKTAFSMVTLWVLLASLMALSGCQVVQLSKAAEVEEPPVYVSDDALTYRWQALADFYKRAGLLTRDDFDYERAADVHAARWVAMGKFYQDKDLLTRSTFDYERQAKFEAQRWIAMARFYEQAGMLTR